MTVSNQTRVFAWLLAGLVGVFGLMAIMVAYMPVVLGVTAVLVPVGGLLYGLWQLAGATTDDK